MYKFENDSTKKLIKFFAKGFILKDEAETIYNELNSVLKTYKPKEALILADVSGLQPASAEVVPVIMNIQKLTIENSKKCASVQAAGLASTQLKRVGSETGANDELRRFDTEEEALKYLLG